MESPSPEYMDFARPRKVQGFEPREVRYPNGSPNSPTPPSAYPKVVRSRSASRSNVDNENHPLRTTPLTPPVSPTHRRQWVPFTVRFNEFIRSEDGGMTLISLVFLVSLTILTRLSGWMGPSSKVTEPHQITAHDIAAIPEAYTEFARNASAVVRDDEWLMDSAHLKNKLPSEIEGQGWWWQERDFPDYKMKTTLEKWDFAIIRLSIDLTAYHSMVDQMLNGMATVTKDLLADLNQIADGELTETDNNAKLPTTKYFHMWNDRDSFRCWFSRCPSKVDTYRAMYIKWLKQLGYGRTYDHGGAYPSDARKFVSLMPVVRSTAELLEKLENSTKEDRRMKSDFIDYIQLETDSPIEKFGSKSQKRQRLNTLQQWLDGGLEKGIVMRRYTLKSIATLSENLDVIKDRMSSLYDLLEDETGTVFEYEDMLPSPMLFNSHILTMVTAQGHSVEAKNALARVKEGGAYMTAVVKMVESLNKPRHPKAKHWFPQSLWVGACSLIQKSRSLIWGSDK